jgi:hypothetical protein
MDLHFRSQAATVVNPIFYRILSSTGTASSSVNKTLVDSFEQLNAMVDAWDAADDARRIGTRPHTVGEHFAIERPLLQPLPTETFETGIWLSPRPDRFSQITVRTNRYSVPVHLVGRQVRVQLHASHLDVYDGRTQMARHERLMAKASSRLDLDHYLEALVRKPGALPDQLLRRRRTAEGTGS